jgi:hypothetical protein
MNAPNDGNNMNDEDWEFVKSLQREAYKLKAEVSALRKILEGVETEGKLPAEGWKARLEEILKTPGYIEFLQFCEARIARAGFERAARRVLLLEPPPTKLLQ